MESFSAPLIVRLLLRDETSWHRNIDLHLAEGVDFIQVSALRFLKLRPDMCT